jgi:Flp pilus assembly protein protease CpaA
VATTIENLINKSAADKDAAMMKDLNTKVNSVPTTAPAAADAKAAPAQPFDIGKFAGIFAAFGMALGALGTALTKIFGGLLSLPPWKTLIAIVAVLLVISGPAMVLAWLKLRRRNIAPLLNANGWAVNAASKISIPFGETLTDSAKFPKMKLKDPYAKGLATWKKWVITISALAVVAAGLWIFGLLSWAGARSPFARFNEPAVVECCETACEGCDTPCTETVAETAQ